MIKEGVETIGLKPAHNVVLSHWPWQQCPKPGLILQGSLFGHAPPHPTGFLRSGFSRSTQWAMLARAEILSSCTPSHPARLSGSL